MSKYKDIDYEMMEFERLAPPKRRVKPDLEQKDWIQLNETEINTLEKCSNLPWFLKEQIL